MAVFASVGGRDDCPNSTLGNHCEQQNSAVDGMGSENGSSEEEVLKSQGETRVIGSKIERAIEAEDWQGARWLILSGLKNAPDDHWLRARLALTYYEERDYVKALRCALEAADLAPQCPLVLWEIAGAMEMLGQSSAALRVYRKLTRKSLDDIAHGPCGEGIVWARGLVADIYFRVGQIHKEAGRRVLARRALEKALACRKGRASGIYSTREIRAHLRRLQT